MTDDTSSLFAGVMAGAIFGGLCIASVLRDIDKDTNELPTNDIRFEPPFIGSLDQGTSSTRFIVFDAKRRQVVSHQMELEHVRPHPG